MQFFFLIDRVIQEEGLYVKQNQNHSINKAQNSLLEITRALFCAVV